MQLTILPNFKYKLSVVSTIKCKLFVMFKVLFYAYGWKTHQCFGFSKALQTCLFHIYHFVQQSFVWKMSVIAKNKVPDGGGENRHMLQLFLITLFLALVKMKTYPLKDRIVALQMWGVHIVATQKFVSLLLRVAFVIYILVGDTCMHLLCACMCEYVYKLFSHLDLLLWVEWLSTYFQLPVRHALYRILV